MTAREWVKLVAIVVYTCIGLGCMVATVVLEIQ